MSITIKTTRSGYKQFWRDGKRLPSPTTVINRFKDSGGLIYWANQQGLDGLTLDDAREQVTTPGSIVHSRIEAHIRGHEWDRLEWVAKIERAKLDADEVWRKADASWQAFLDWSSLTTLEPVNAEISLASEKHGFGGTMDAVAVSSTLALGDWKTGNLYPDHLIQMGAYTLLWEENMPEHPISQCFLLSINKDHGGFTYSSFPRAAMQIASDQFLVLLDAFRRDKQLKKML